MKLLRYFFLSMAIGTSVSASAQDVRTSATRTADALALLPAKDALTSSLVYAELMALDDEGFAKVVEGVQPAGDAAGVAFRYAVALLATQGPPATDRSRLEAAIVVALRKQVSAEVKQYYLGYLARVGTDRSVPALAGLLDDVDLVDPAVGALEAIGSPAALEILRIGLDKQPAPVQIRMIEALGRGRHKPSVQVLLPFINSGDVTLKREALWALAVIGDPTVEATLIAQAAAAGYKESPAQEVEALIRYAEVRSAEGQYAESAIQAMLMNTLTQSQEHYRLAALKAMLPATAPKPKVSFLNKEFDRFDAGYRRNVLALAAITAQEEIPRKGWIDLYRRSKGDEQAEILAMLTNVNSDSLFVAQVVLPALDSKYPAVRKVAIQSIGGTRQPRYADRLAAMLINPSRTEDERAEATRAFLQVAQPSHVRSLAKLLPQVNPVPAVNIVNILATRRDVEDGATVISLTASPDRALRAAAFAALPNIASPSSVPALLNLLQQTRELKEVADIQQALAAVAGPETAPMIRQAATTQKARLLPVLPYLGDKESLQTVRASFANGQGEEKELAFAALLDWQSGEAASALLEILRDKTAAGHSRAFQAYVKQVMRTDWPADQKLLRLREAFPLAATKEERQAVIRAAGNVRTFLSLVFVASWLDDPELGASASRSAMVLALPTADGQPGMTGLEVRKALEKVMERLTGPDSQYDRIDVQTYLDQMPFTLGFESLFNGKDLTGWQGLVENPIARAKMTKEQLAAKQAAADAKLPGSWSVKDGMICFTGSGENLCTKRSFGDFELLVDWKIPRNGDSGIYLRGSPQVQIWDIARADVGAEFGSGGLYNNTDNRNPRVVADNPVGEWNTFRITMIGERVTVYLNGVLVVDNVVMENYWDRKIPIFPDGPIELQTHGTELAFRNLYVKEFNRPYQLSDEEKQQGFALLFNSKDLSGWVGNKTDYVVEDQVIAIHPTGRGKGDLYTEKEYSDFVFRFEFQLSPAGNNGLGIHAPGDGDAAYVGKEIQIIDDGHPIYADLKPWQMHGSVYGVIAAKRGALRPVGQWNEEEVEVRGDRIKVTVNGIVIVDGDMKKASVKGTLDGKEHPGLLRHTGHIGFLGHGSVVRFRNLRIRDLSRR